MQASHDPALVVKSLREIIAPFRGMILSHAVAEALGHDISAGWPIVAPSEAAQFFKGHHIGKVLDGDLIHERARNVATLVCLMAAEDAA